MDIKKLSAIGVDAVASDDFFLYICINIKEESKRGGDVMDSKIEDPIIFIPGLMGSIGGDMLGRQGKWSFGAAGWIYRPFIRKLEELGYKQNQNLFICYYDWRKNCDEIVNDYLIPLILQIEKSYPDRKINLLCHSMGGLIGRSYIQSRRYTNNIRNLIFMSTPNKGSIEAYYLWSVGKVKKRDKEEKGLFDIIHNGYVWLLIKMLKIPLEVDNIKRLHDSFPGLGELIPSDDYGPVLCYKNKQDKCLFIRRKHMAFSNSFLNELNKNIDTLISNVENIYCIIGTNNSTDKMLILDGEALLNNKEVYVIGSVKTTEGDGTVIVPSAIINNSNNFIIEGNHGGILGGSIQIISNILNLDQTLLTKDIVAEELNVLSIIFKKHLMIQLENGKNSIAKIEGGMLYTNYEFIFEEFGEDYLWVILKNISPGDYVLRTSSEYNHDYSIYVVGTRVEEEFQNEGIEKQGKSINTYYFKA